MMNILKPIAFDVIHCVSQLFDYYLYAVYTFFGRNDMVRLWYRSRTCFFKFLGFLPINYSAFGLRQIPPIYHSIYKHITTCLCCSHTTNFPNHALRTCRRTLFHNYCYYYLSNLSKCLTFYGCALLLSTPRWVLDVVLTILSPQKQREIPEYLLMIVRLKSSYPTVTLL